MIKVIRTPEDHEQALHRLEELMDGSPVSGSVEASELEVLALLIDEYEKRAFPIGLPDAVEAIKVRMEEQSLSQRDLIPFIGSRSKVSEVLSGKRALTLPMIRALHASLNIPAPILLQERDPSLFESSDVEWQRFPLAEMRSLGWLEASKDALNDPEAVLRGFFGPNALSTAPAALFKRTRNERSARAMDRYAVLAWVARVVARAGVVRTQQAFVPSALTIDVMHEVARLSWSERGPQLAIEYLARLGVAVIVERHLSRTHIDGAALIVENGRAVIGLTLRHDRLDNFWFCLMHELAHLSLHLRSETMTFIDDLDFSDEGNAQEKAADEMAREALIPSDEWRSSAASKLRSADAAIQLANRLKIHPAIVAGRIRFDRKNFRLLNHLVGAGQVQRMFPDVRWK
jgi:HTH-type transcriptional regulator/antitoxin HigA